MIRVKRGLACVMAVVMMASSMNMTAYATTDGQEDTTSLEAVAYTAGEVVDSGSCGENLTWELTRLDEEHLKLTINGTGEMGSMRDPDTYDLCVPWNSYRSQIQQLVISEGATSIGEYAFADCSGLTSVTIPEGVTTIGMAAFLNCSGLTSVTIPEGVTTIWGAAFSNCSSLTSATLPKSLINIYGTGPLDGIFHGCNKLKTAGPAGGGYDIEFSWDDKIPERAFAGCTNLKSVTIPKGVASIGAEAFCWCGFLTNVTIQSGTTSIGEGAFCDCQNLKDVVIPVGMTSIGEYAFDSCLNLSNVFYEGAEEDWAKIQIADGNDKLKNAERICGWHYDVGTTDGKDIAGGHINNGTEQGVDWVIDAEHRLKVTGTGNFKEEGAKYPAWHEYGGTIYSAIVDLKGCTDASHMFSNCILMQTANVSKFDTSTVKSMTNMFYDCGKLDNLDVSTFNTAEVTDMSGMFYKCVALQSLDLSSFNTGKVTDMTEMFRQCNALRNVSLSNFNTENVTSMRRMYLGCVLLQNLDVSKFDTDKVTDMSYMFSACSGLKNLNVSSLNTTNVTDMSHMFSGCSGLESLDLSSFNTANVTDMSYMFYNCSGLKNLNVSSLNTTNVTDMSYMFYNCSGLKNLNVSSLNTTNVTDMSHMFSACSGLENLNVSSLDTTNVTNMSDMFCNCFGLESLNVSSFNTTNVTNMSDMFYGCSSLKILDLSSFDMSGIVCEGMFYDPWTDSYADAYHATMLCGCNLERIEAPVHVGENIIIWFTDHYSATSDEGYSWYRADTNKRIINLPTGLTKSVTLLRRDGTAFTDTLVVKQKTDITDRFNATTPYKKYTVAPKGAATVTGKGILTAKKAAETVTVTGLVKVGKVWKEAESITFKIEAPAIMQKTITATKPGMTINAADNISGTTISPTSWSSSKPAVAEINAQTGVITTKTKGTTKITAVYGEGKNAAKYTFNVKVNIPAMSKTKATVLTGATLKLKLKNVPKNRISEITWASSDKQVAEVDSTGKVSVLSYDESTGGKVSIAAIIDGVPYSCEIEVKKPEIKKNILVIKQGKSGKVALKNTKLKNINWSSSDERIATVDGKGKVVGAAPGTVIIQTTAGGVTNTCEVTVK